MTTRPAAANGRAAGFDLEAAAEAAAREADLEPTTYRFRGVTFEVPNSKRWPFRVQRQIEKGELGAALEGLVGAAVMDQLDGVGWEMRHIEALFEQIGRDAGVGGLGNSPAPSRPGSTRT